MLILTHTATHTSIHTGAVSEYRHFTQTWTDNALQTYELQSNVSSTIASLYSLTSEPLGDMHLVMQMWWKMYMSNVWICAQVTFTQMSLDVQIKSTSYKFGFMNISIKHSTAQDSCPAPTFSASSHICLSCRRPHFTFGLCSNHNCNIFQTITSWFCFG